MLELRWSGKKEWDFFSSKLYLIVLLILFPLCFVLKKNLEKEIDNPAISLEFQWSKGMEEDPYRAVGPLIHLSSHTTSKTPLLLGSPVDTIKVLFQENGICHHIWTLLSVTSVATKDSFLSPQHTVISLNKEDKGKKKNK